MLEKINIKELGCVDLRVGRIVSVVLHPEADRLFVLSVDLGEDKFRTIVAGLREHYDPEELEGRKAIFVANLEPVTLRGVESNGMILAAVTEGKTKVSFITPEKDVLEGTKIS